MRSQDLSKGGGAQRRDMLGFDNSSQSSRSSPGGIISEYHNYVRAKSFWGTKPPPLPSSYTVGDTNCTTQVVIVSAVTNL